MGRAGSRHAADIADELTAGRTACARQEWAQAYEQLSAADARTPLGIDDLERLAMAAFLVGRDEESSELWERAHGECVRLQDVPRAARCTFWLVNDLLTRGEHARAGGWLARTQRLLDEGPYDCAERGLLLVLSARSLIRQGDVTAAAECERQAAELIDRFADPELALFGRLILAQIRMRRDEAAGAATLFDELMVEVTVGAVSPIAVGVVYCAVIDACHYLFDLPRAREWTAALSRWCGAQPDLVPFRGQCLVHRAEVLRLSGAWPQALAEAEHACSWLLQSAGQQDDAVEEHQLPSFKYPVGAAFYELAELHRVRGDYPSADASYRQASAYGRSPEPGLALLRLAEGRVAAAEAAMRRLLGEPQGRLTRAAVLAACVEIMIAVADLATARTAADELADLAAAVSAPFLRALSAQATGSVLFAEGDARAALAALRDAWMGWQELETPYEAARVRVLLGLACRALGDAEAAELELDAARRVFERLEAAPDGARVQALTRTVNPSHAGVLTRRERQVIGLVATGRTNRAIAQELGISERTVDRHVSNILTKLNVPSRSAATAYAYEHGLV